jgi:hypothetical protein
MLGRLMDSRQDWSVRPGGIRVIICDPDEQLRARLQAIIKTDSVLVLASATCNWPQCESDLDSLLPELLIVRSSLIPTNHRTRFRTDGAFPVLITFSELTDQEGSAENSGDLPLPLDPEATRHSLDRAVLEIYNRKAKQLSDLVSHYISGLAELREYRSAITVERDGQSWDLNTRSILTVLAARKSVWINSLSGRFMLRKPIYQVAAELDPSTFFRISRSVIVNRYFLDSRATLDSKASHAILTDGSKYVVGLDCRDSITRILKSDLALSAGTRA